MTSEVYPPSEDSELLLEAAMREIRLEDEVLEVGVGSGFVSERIKDLCRFLIATDISPYAVRESKSKGIEVVRTDLCRGIRRKFTLILFNPPYLELSEKEKRGDWLEKAVDGGKGGIEVATRFLDEVKEVLAENGRIILIVSSFNTPAIFEEIEKRGYVYEVIAGRKLFFEELYALKIWRG
ncbi:HemK2/MTQ2 family protein methyltransferase [Archaeoglobus veneficus]|uniref:Methylase n=1 Tax=Archaeoglobus veneficus (strain DSM 11195 / SNP6) TaxID=693661 RepID=F2KPK3_ARCVS|nr:HemK2/MTQ2 family protein methyltransferase [Archaeoglobus veneficus]AEA46434.1 methylase [Archaeoglobus veneficus SNP6]